MTDLREDMRTMLRTIFKIPDRKEKLRLVLMLFMILISTGLELLGVASIQPLIEAVTDPTVLDKGRLFPFLKSLIRTENNTDLVIFMALALALIFVIKNLYLIWMNSVFFRFSYDLQQTISLRMMQGYLKRDYSFHVKHNVAELQRNVETDVGRFYLTMISLLQLITELMVCSALFVLLAFTDLATTILVTALMGILVVLLLFVLRKRIKYLGERNREYCMLRLKWFLKSFGGIKEIKVSGKENYFFHGYEDSFRNFTKVAYEQSILNNLSKPVVEMVFVGGIMIFMALRISWGKDLEEFVPVLSVFAMAALRMMPSFNRISGQMNSIMFNRSSVDAIYRELEEMKAIKEQTRLEQKGETLHINEGIRVEHLDFHYSSKADTEVLKDVSLFIPKKHSVALVGPSGAGKTTLADIILGIYDPVRGAVLADDKKIHENLDSWHKLIAYIPQNIYLMDDTIRNNIAFGIPEEEINDEKIWQVLEEAQLDDFVREQPQQLDTIVGDRGVRLSGGQRQRIGIARALYPDPEFLVLDEATSALDTETETAVMDAIYRLSGKITMVVIAHRITTIRGCDEIYRISEGKAEKISYEEASAT